MISAKKSLQKREEELKAIYGRYATPWAEDWPNYVKITFTRDLFKERIQNKNQIFFLFYPMIGIIIAAIISLIIGIASKSLVWLPVFVILTVLIAVVYNSYFYFLEMKVRHMNQIIGHYYSKYGRHSLKELYKKYRADELPPEPEKFYEMDTNWFYEDEMRDEDIALAKEGKRDGEPEKTEAEYAFDLRLVGGDDQNDSGDNAPSVADNSSDADDAGDSTETDPEGSDSGEPESAIPEETEEESRRNNEVEAVTVIDADLPEPEPDDWDYSEEETLQDVLEEDGDDIEQIIDELNDWPDGEELSEDSETFVDDLYDELEDYKPDEEEFVDEEPEIIVEEPVPEEEPKPVESPIKAGGKAEPEPIPELKTFDEFFAYFQLDNG